MMTTNGKTPHPEIEIDYDLDEAIGRLALNNDLPEDYQHTPAPTTEPAAPQRAIVEPVAAPLRSRGRGNVSKLTLVGLSFVVLVLMFKSCQPDQPPMMLQPPIGAPQQPQQRTAQQPQQNDRPRLAAAVVQKNVEFDEAIKLVPSVTDDVLCARTQYFLNVAQAQLDAKGTAIEDTLVDKLNIANGRLSKAALQRANYSGSAEQIAVISPIVLDIQALLMALQSTYNGDPLKQCSVSPSNLAVQVQEYIDQSKLIIQSRDEALKLKLQAEQGDNDGSN